MVYAMVSLSDLGYDEMYLYRKKMFLFCTMTYILLFDAFLDLLVIRVKEMFLFFK